MRDYDPRHDRMLLPCGWSSCGAVPTRPFAMGDRCAEHTPAALAGRPEPGLSCTPYRPQGNYPMPKTTVIDDRAVASGKRRSNPHARLEAKARELERQNRNSGQD